MPTDVTPNLAFQAGNVVIPVEGPKTVPVVLDYNGVADGIFTVDGNQLVQQVKVSYIQALFVDNADNPNPLTITMNLVNQRIVVPANSQGYYPVLQPNPPLFTFATTTGNFKVQIQFLNVPIQPMVWGATLGGGGGGSSTPPTFTDKRLVLDGTSQELIAAGTGSHYVAIENPPTNANNITVNLAGGNALASGIILIPGGAITLETGVTNAITVAGTNLDVVEAFAG